MKAFLLYLVFHIISNAGFELVSVVVAKLPISTHQAAAGQYLNVLQLFCFTYTMFQIEKNEKEINFLSFPWICL